MNHEETRLKDPGPSKAVSCKFIYVFFLSGVLQSHEPTLTEAKAALDAALASQLQQSDVIGSEDPDAASTTGTTPLSAAVSYQA